jgi:hypothetical protein
MHGTVHFSTLFLDIGGMQIARQMSLSETPSALSENSEFNILRSTNFLWNFPIFQQPISIKPVVFPMMFVKQSASRAYLQKNIDKKHFLLKKFKHF